VHLKCLKAETLFQLRSASLFMNLVHTSFFTENKGRKTRNKELHSTLFKLA